MNSKNIALLVVGVIIGSSVGYGGGAFMIFSPKMDDLETSLTELESQYETLQQEHGNLSDQYSSLSDNYDDLSEEYDDLKAKHIEIERNHNILQEEYENLQKDIKILQEEYGELLKSYQVINEKYEPLKLNYTYLINLLNISEVKRYTQIINYTIYTGNEETWLFYLPYGAIWEAKIRLSYDYCGMSHA